MPKKSKLSYFEDESSDELIQYLKDHGWSIGEAGVNGGWMAFAAIDGLRFEGIGPRQENAWQDLLFKMMLAGRFSRN
jgi:hypothetical protein